MEQVFKITLTRQEVAIIGQALQEAPFKLVAGVINNLAQQVQAQENSDAQQVSSTSKDNGGGGPRPEIRKESGDPPISSKGVQSSGRKDGHSSQQKEA